MADNSNQTAIRSLGAQIANLAISKAMADQDNAELTDKVENLQQQVQDLQQALNAANQRLIQATTPETVGGEVVRDGEGTDPQS